MSESESVRGERGLKHEIEWDGKTAMITLEGEVDMRVAPSLRGILHDVIEKGPDQVMVDLSGVPFIDSSGVATFVEALRLLMQGNRKLLLKDPSEAVRYTLKITQLLGVFGLEEQKS